MRRAVLLTLLSLPPVSLAASEPDADRVRATLERASRHHPPPEPGLLRLVYLGTSDPAAVDQSRQPGVPQPGRTQELLLLDPQERRAALDTQAIGADGTPGLWRHQINPKGVRSTNRKSGQRFESGADESAMRWRALSWRLPALALAELSAAVDRVRWVGRRTVRGTAVDVLAFQPQGSAEIEVLFRPSGELAGYAHQAARMRGPTRLETWFKPSMLTSGLGRIPGGYVLRVGNAVYKDLTLLDARSTARREDAWLGLARAGATVLTTPGNAALARAMLAGVPGAKVETVQGTRVFADGPSRMEVRRLEQGLHTQEMLFAYFPAAAAAITADVTDYLVEEKRLLQHLDAAGLRLETVHAVHSARPIAAGDLREDLDFSN